MSVAVLGRGVGAGRRGAAVGRAVGAGRRGAALGGAGRRGIAAAIVLGGVADVLFGDPRRGHPVALFGSAAVRLERGIYRPTRRAGTVFAVVLAGSVAGAAAVIERRAAGVPGLRVLAQAVALWVALGGRSLAREALAVDALVAAGDVAGGRERVRSLVGRDPAALDGAGLRRAAIESVAENTADAVVAPLVWLAAAGSPGVLGYRAVNTLDAMVGRRSPRYARFGTPSARTDDALNVVPARLTAGLAVVLAPAVGGSPRAAARAWRRDAPAHPSPNAGPVEAAFAGALGLRLGGTLAYAGRVEHRPTLNPAGNEPGPADVARAVRLARLVGAVSALICASAATGWSRLTAHIPGNLDHPQRRGGRTGARGSRGVRR